MRQRNRDSFLNKIIIVLVIFIILVIGILIYNTFHYGYKIELIGGNDITIYLNDYYQDPGFVAYNRSGKNVTNSVKVNGSVDTSKEGTYEITYQIGGVKEIRKVSVIYDIRNDLTLTLVGDNPKYILKGVTYSFDDCKAYDKNQGDITSKIIVNSNVNFNEKGEYEVEYSIVNSNGIKKSISQKVIVYDIEYVLNENIIDNKHVINITFDETYYQKVKLPDGSFIITNNVSYTFGENGEYILEVYDKYNNIKKINIVVSKIDKIDPTGTCVVNLYDNNSKIIVNANDNQSIKGYIYNYGNKKSDLLTNSEFIYTDMVNEANVTIYDMANNNININCEVKDLSTHYPRSYTKEQNGYKYWLYIPSTLTKRGEVPLVVFIHGKGECGTNLNLINRNSFPKYINEGADYNFVMIAPQILENACARSIDTLKLKNIIDDVIQKYHLNERRVFVTGFSYGAKNTYRMVNAYPDFFAGAIAVAFDPPFKDYTNLLKTPILGFHGTIDARYNEHMKAVNTISQSNPKTKFFSLKGINHEKTPPLVYKDNQEVLDFIATMYR